MTPGPARGPGEDRDARPTRRGIPRRAWRTMWLHPYLLGAAIATMALDSSVVPSFAWMGKEVIDEFSAEGIDAHAAVGYMPWFAVVLVSWTGLRLAAKMARKAYQTRMVIALQRVYLERAPDEARRNDLARVLWDAKKGEEALQLVYEEAPKIGASVLAVVGWQFALAPAWFPALAVAVVPTLVAVSFFGPFIQGTSLGVMRGVNDVARATQRRDIGDVHRHQEALYRRFVRYYLFYNSADVILDALFWSGILLVVLGDAFLGLPLVPKDAELGDPVFFWAQLKLLSAPLARVGKAYNKYRAARPALDRVYGPPAAPQLV